MTVKTSSVNPIAETLKKMGITSGRKLADHTRAQAVIYFLAKDEQGENSPRAVLYLNGKKTVYRPQGRDGGTLSAIRHQTVGRAQKDAAEQLGLDDWRRTPFSNCWLPVDSINRMRAELGLEPMED